MTPASVSYNERAWATDVIGEINQWLSTRSLVVRSAGGEWGVAAQDEANTLFPDVLLFGDMKRAAVLQGWELKMPDTPITDEAFTDNARKKALRLGLNRFCSGTPRKPHSTIAMKHIATSSRHGIATA
ncbi:MAG: hypothetical protein ACOX5G_13470 [Kiritimatiellia bacterium]|jgi:hypothetical protein